MCLTIVWSEVRERIELFERLEHRRGRHVVVVGALLLLGQVEQELFGFQAGISKVL
jgi:hypothetical protein